MIEILKDIRDRYKDRQRPQTTNPDYYKHTEAPKGPYAKDPERFNRGVLRFIPSVFKNLLNFTGRTSRLQYIKNLMWLAVFFLIGVIIITACGFKPRSDQYRLIVNVLTIVIGLGLASSTCRRLVHAGYPWFDIFVILIPLVGPFIFLWKLIQPQDADPYQSLCVYRHGRDIYEEYRK